jgi:predicted RNA-binding Zn-ribbon protein involved in translation (DUF1610 family)
MKDETKMDTMGIFIIVCGLVIFFVLLFMLIVCITDARAEKEIEKKREPCPKCGSKKHMLCIEVSDGYQYVTCENCGYKFQDKSDSAITVTFDSGSYELSKPEINQDGKPIR